MTDFARLSIAVDSTGVKPAIDQINKLGDAGDRVIGIMKGIGTVLGLAAIGKAVGDLATLRARYDTLGVVMKVVGNNAGYTGAQMEQFAQSLQKAGISMVESRNTLAMMASAHMDLTKASDLGRVAQDAAVIGNINSSEAFQRMIYGIQSGQVEILRTIGINVNFENSYKKIAAQLKKNVADLTETEKVQARTNVVMAKGKDIAGAYEESLGTVGKAAKSMERIWENLQVVIGGTFQEGFAVIVENLTSAMQVGSDWAKTYAKELGELGTAMANVGRSGADFAKLLGDIGGGSKGAGEAVGFLTRVFQGINLIVAGTTDVVRAFWGELSGFAGDMIQKLGRVVDLATTLAGWSGKGGISRFGESLSNYGNNITGALNSETATGNALDRMLASHSTATTATNREAERIAAAATAKKLADEEERRLKAGEAFRKVLSDQVAFFEKQGDAYNKAIMSEKELLDIELKRLKIRGSAAAIAGFQQEATDLAKLEIKIRDLDLPEVGTVQPSPLSTIFTPQMVINADNFALAMERVRIEEQRLRAESGDTWALIGQVVQSAAGMATDKLTDWMNATDGLARTWQSFGDTLKAILRDIVIAMQKAIIQQQFMQPLMNWASNGSNWTSLIGAFASGSGTTATTGGTAGGGLNLGEASIQSGARVEPTINISINSNGTTDTKATGEGAAELGRMVNAVCDQWAVKNMRAGGLLARA